MEVQNVDRTTPEILPDWLLDPSLQIQHVTIGQLKHKKMQPPVPAEEWSLRLKATQVNFFKNRKSKAKSRLPEVDIVDHPDSSDDSHACMSIAIYFWLKLFCAFSDFCACCRS
jgi:hypothetical protein